MKTMNANTVRVTPRPDGSWCYEVRDSLDRVQATFDTMNEAVGFAGSICRFGWRLDLPGHSGTGDCAHEHEGYAEMHRLNGHRVVQVRVGL